MDPKLEHAFWDAAAERGFQSAVDIIAADWSAWEGDVLERSIARAFGNQPPAFDARILDLGCGAGRMAIPIAERFGVHVIGVDISSAMLRLALERTPPGVTIEWLLGDGRKLPDVGLLDAAYSMITFQHIPKDAVASYIAQVAKHLKVGGVFRFQTLEPSGRECTKEGSEDADEFLHHTVSELWVRQACKNAGLEIVSYEKFTSEVENLVAPWTTAVKEK